MDTKKLRQKILDLAIHGKLVPQDPNDEPASVLLERIRAEKERLIKEGKIKQSKKSAKSSDTPHYENEVPFEVPEGWEWTTLGELCSFLSRGKSPKYSEERKYPVFAQKCNLYDGDISLEKARFLDPETISKWSDEYKLIDGDILVNSTGTGTVGRTRLFHSDVLGDYPFVVPDSHVSVIRSFEEIESKFVLAFLSSDYGQTYIEDNLAGSTNQKELYIGVLDNMQFPLPPHEEQFRIVTTVDKWFTLIDTLESAKEDLQASITQAKSKILDLAIHGKLVPQDPNDEPVIELLKRINPKFVPCDNAQYPYEVPCNWILCELGDLYNIVSAKRVHKSEWQHYGIPFYRAREIVKLSDEGEVDNELFITEEHYNDLKKKYGVPKPTDIMMSAVGTIGKTYIVKADDVFYYKDASVICLQNTNELYSPYISILLSSNFLQEQMFAQSKGTTVDTITIEKANSYKIPFPPLSEQKRIVAKIEELFAVLDEIKKSLEA